MKKLSYIPLLLCICSAAFVQAQTPEEKGLEIAKAQKARNVGWKDSRSQMKMTLRTASGRENVRTISVKSLEVADDGDKSLMVFNEPKDVEGTAFLSFSHITGPDDQWIFLPALKRVKRISSNKKSGSFMGSEFSYEDLSSFEVEKYKFTYLRDEACGNGQTCHVIESIPTDKNSGYSKLISWIDTKELRSEKIEFYDRKNTLLKTMVIKEYKLYEDKFWRPVVSLMTNHQSGKSTELSWGELQLNVGLQESDFSKNNLKRAK